MHNSIWVDDDADNDYMDGAPSARYDVVDGEVLAIKQGANRYVYVPDPLGSVNHLLDTSLNKAATYVYWPYGELQTNTGAGSNRQFVGALGYDTLTTNRVYVRARDYRPDLGRWQTEDPSGFGLRQGAEYVWGRPSALTDPSGLHPLSQPCMGPDLAACQTICGVGGVMQCTVSYKPAGRSCLPPIRTTLCRCKKGACDSELAICLKQAELRDRACTVEATGLLAICAMICNANVLYQIVCLTAFKYALAGCSENYIADFKRCYHAYWACLDHTA